MKFIETKLKGSFIIDPERLEDERGFFARSWCQQEAKQYGLEPEWLQCNVSYNKSKGTMRGMHYQAAPFEESKLVRCTMGAICDVIIDLRPDSVTFKKWTAVELSSENRRMFYIPGGFAHGFLTLQDSTEIFYQMSEFYAPACARGVRWNDPAFGILWPTDIAVISAQDQNYPNFTG
jgi:dTDP-4-dehydrorhamnose 3,5-epimerase